MDLLLCFLLSLPIVFLSLYFVKKADKHDNIITVPPGPPGIPIIGNLHQIGALPHRSFATLAMRYGPVMLLRFGMKPTVIVSSKETAKEVLQTHDLDFCSRPLLAGAKRLSYDLRDIVFTPYGDYWKNMKRICVLELFNSSRVRSFRCVREEEVANMVRSISLSQSGPLNLTEILFSLTFQVTCRTAFGSNYQSDYLKFGEFREAVFAAMKLLGSFSATDFFPYFGRIIDGLNGNRKKLERCFSVFDAFYQKIIDEHLDSMLTKPDNEDILHLLLSLQGDKSSPVHLTISHIKAILMNIFLGGIDTSAVTMVWAMTELCRNPVTMTKLQEEIRSCVGNKGKVDENDINQLQYLKMVVKETLRLHPPVMLLVPRECMNHSKIKGYEVHPKTQVLVNVWAISRSKEYWEHPDDFIPERFIDELIDFKGQDFEFLPFGSGRRICPGMKTGIATVELGLANILYCFNWKLPRGMKKDDVNMDEMAGATLHKKFPLHLVPIKYNVE